MEAVQLEGIDCGDAVPAKPGPAVVKRPWPVGEPEPRQVEGHAAETAGGKLVQHLAVQVRRGGHAVHAYDRLAAARLAHEPVQARGAERAAGRDVRVDLRTRHGRIPPFVMGRLRRDR